MKRPDWKGDNWWELAPGWRVHLNPGPHFGRCWNTVSGEECDFDTLRLALYGPSLEAWTRLVTSALAHGRNKKPQS